jgi:hypothetical protein
MNWKSYLTSFAVWIHAAVSLAGGALIAAASQYLQSGGVIPTTPAQWHSAAATVVAAALAIMAAHLKQSPIQTVPNPPAPPAN